MRGEESLLFESMRNTCLPSHFYGIALGSLTFSAILSTFSECHTSHTQHGDNTIQIYFLVDSLNNKILWLLNKLQFYRIVGLLKAPATFYGFPLTFRIQKRSYILYIIHIYLSIFSHRVIDEMLLLSFISTFYASPMIIKCATQTDWILSTLTVNSNAFATCIRIVAKAPADVIAMNWQITLYMGTH